MSARCWSRWASGRLVVGRHGLVVGHRQREAHGEVAGAALQHRHHPLVGGEEVVGGRREPGLVDRSRREEPQQVADRGDHVGLVDRAGPADEVAEVAHRLLREAQVALDDAGAVPPALGHRPPRRREVVEGDHRLDPVGEARGAHPAVVVEGRHRELAGLGLDPRPLQREPVVVEPERGQQGDVVVVAVQLVAGVATRLLTGRALGVLPGPPVVVPVAPLDLVRGGGGAPSEAVREVGAHGAGR